MTVGQEQRVVNKGITWKESAETLRTLGMGTTSSKLCTEHHGAEQGTGRPGFTLALAAASKTSLILQRRNYKQKVLNFEARFKPKQTNKKSK